MGREWRYIGSFGAVDAQGNTYLINVEQEFIITGQSETAGLRRLTTSAGEHVMPIGPRKSDGSREYKMVSPISGEATRITSIDPAQSCADE
jgi:hypothetical protein